MSGTRLLGPIYVGPNRVDLLGDAWTGGLVVAVNGQRGDFPRGDAQVLAENLARHLETSAACPRCEHPRLDHFRLFTRGGHLNGCAHGTGVDYQLATGLPCDCPGVPGD
jgi:hypothetical protein